MAAQSGKQTSCDMRGTDGAAAQQDYEKETVGVSVSKHHSLILLKPVIIKLDVFNFTGWSGGVSSTWPEDSWDRTQRPSNPATPTGRLDGKWIYEKT